MLIIKHRVNTVHELKATPEEFGVEVDIRPHNDNLILHHEPFVEGQYFESFLQNFNHAFIVLNIKSEGTEQKVIELMNKYGIENYFLLDVTFPFVIKLINKNISKIAMRFSEYESIETCLRLKGKVEWIWVDNFSRLPLDEESVKKLKKYFKICVVSPDLLGRIKDIEKTRKLIISYDVDAVCTKNVEAWK